MKKTLPIIMICSIILIAAPLIANALILENPLQYDDLNKLIEGIADALAILASAVGVVMIIIAGIQYMTSAGNEEQAKKARKTIFYTIIGVAIVLAADFIVNLVGELLRKKP